MKVPKKVKETITICVSNDNSRRHWWKKFNLKNLPYSSVFLDAFHENQFLVFHENQKT